MITISSGKSQHPENAFIDKGSICKNKEHPNLGLIPFKISDNFILISTKFDIIPEDH